MNLSTQPAATDSYGLLIEQISISYAAGQAKTMQAINETLVQTYWQIGRYIVEFEQGGNAKAVYGKSPAGKPVQRVKPAAWKGF